MGKENERNVVKGNLYSDFASRIKLILRLMGDRRVSLLLKLIPIGALIYFFIPDLVIGPLDDVFILWLASYLFIELCPPHIVEEHKMALNQVIRGDWREPPEKDAEVIDSSFKEVK
jgi:uncharacterized membrane protein YkvA (DUF1232 family)